MITHWRLIMNNSKGKSIFQTAYNPFISSSVECDNNRIFYGMCSVDKKKQCYYSWLNENFSIFLFNCPFRNTFELDTKMPVFFCLFSICLISLFRLLWFCCGWMWMVNNEGFGALAALKRKRKKFSKSRNTSPVLEPSTPSKVEQSPNKKVIHQTLS